MYPNTRNIWLFWSLSLGSIKGFFPNPTKRSHNSHVSLVGPIQSWLSLLLNRTPWRRAWCCCTSSWPPRRSCDCHSARGWTCPARGRPLPALRWQTGTRTIAFGTTSFWRKLREKSSDWITGTRKKAGQGLEPVTSNQQRLVHMTTLSLDSNPKPSTGFFKFFTWPHDYFTSYWSFYAKLLTYFLVEWLDC